MSTASRESESIIHDKHDKITGEVLSYNPSSNRNEFMGYTERSVHNGHGKMFKITTRRGHSITVTDDHSLATAGTDTFFDPLKPENSLGRVVPILSSLEYEASSFTELAATDEMSKDIHAGGPLKFKEYMLELPKLFILPVVLSLFDSESHNTYSYAADTEDDLELGKLVLAKLGFEGYKIEGLRIILYADGERLIPDDGELKPVSLVSSSNPANPYLRLPYDWDIITYVEEVSREEITYDFSVPGFPLFIGNGILVYDTMQLHVPATEEARTEALEKMLPSKNLFSPRTLEPMMLPQQEHVFGLFSASKNVKKIGASTKCTNVMNTQKLLQDIKMDVLKPDAPVLYNGKKTTAGLVLINDLLPANLRKYDEPWDKPVMTKILSQIGKKDPKNYTKVADGLKELGSLFSYKMGVSYKASDFDMPDLKKKRDAYFKKIDKELAAVDARKGLSKKQVEEEKGKILRKAQAFSQKLTDNATGNTFQQWAYTGSKGSKSQVMQIITSPTVVADPKDKLIPALIHTSYNEGLSPADYWVSSYGTRKGTVGAKMSVAPAGALSKELIGNVLDIVVSKKDCGTKRGLKYSIDDTKNVLNRVEAKTNKFIDANYYEMLKKKKVKEVEVRSPATCECRDGVCQFCYGYNEKLKFPDIGENVGVVSTHAITEPLTQMGLSSKHTAGTASDGAVGFNTVKAFFNMSTKFSGAAVITEVKGKVTRIEKAPTGGSNLYIGKKKYYIPPNRILKVKVGDSVEAGDPLTDGILNISKVVPHKGIDTGRKTFIDSVSNLYSKAGVDSIKKNFEVVSRGLINYVQIQNPNDFDDYIEGDVVDYNQLMADIRKNPGKKAPTYVPFQKGTNKAPTYKKDWLANFGFKYLKGELIENAATHATSPLHSYHPIPSYARGAQFGKGENGKY